MARTFDGSNDHIDLSPGTAGAQFTGLTIAAIMRLDAAPSSDYDMILQAETSGGDEHFYFGWHPAGRIVFGNGSSERGNTNMTGQANRWQLVAVTKGSGTVIPRFHRYDFTNATWTHADASSGSSTNGVNAASLIQIGCYIGNVNVFDGDIALVGVWLSGLSDNGVEALVANLNTTDWTGHNTPPAAVWELNQASVSTAVEDLTGNGADQTDIGGTSVSASDPPGWTYTGGGEEPETHSGTSLVTGTGSPSAAGHKVGAGAAVVAGAGAVSATGQKTALSSSLITGTGALEAAGHKIAAGAAEMTAAGTPTAGGLKVGLGSAVVTGTGSPTASGSSTATGTATLTGTGAPVAGDGEKIAHASSLVTGTGTVTAEGHQVVATTLPSIDQPVTAVLDARTVNVTLDAHPVTVTFDAHARTVNLDPNLREVALDG